MVKELEKVLNHIESGLRRVSPLVNSHHAQEPGRTSELEEIEEALRVAARKVRRELNSRKR